FTGHLVGTAKIHVVDGSFTDDSGTLTVTPGAADPTTTTITASPTSAPVDIGSSTITVQAKDQYGNDLTSGGDSVTLSADHGALGSTTPIDNSDGTYTTTLSDTHARTDTVTGHLNTVAITDDATVEFTPGAATDVTIETAANGSGSHVNAQSVTAG